jgi:hypothetical protein
MAKQKSKPVPKTPINTDSGCMSNLRKYGRYSLIVFGACCFITFAISLFAPETDEIAIPTLRVLPSLTASPIPDTETPTIAPTNSHTPTATSEPTETVDVTGTSDAIAAIVAATQIALLPSSTPQATQPPSPTNDPLIFTVEAMQTALELTQNAPTHTPVQPTATSAVFFPTALPEVAQLESWLEQQAGVDVVQSISVRGQPLLFYAEVIVYPGYNTVAFAEAFNAASMQLAAGRAIGQVAIIISDGEQAIDYTLNSFDDDWGITILSVDAPTPRPNNQAVIAATAVLSINRTGGTTRYANTGDVRIRTCPQGGATGCEVIAVLSSGEAITTYGTREGSAYDGSTLWYETVYNGRDGFVHTRLVQNSPPPAPTSVPVVVPNTGGTGAQTNNVRPDNCADAIAMGLTAQQAGQWSHLDRDNDGVACYGD